MAFALKFNGLACPDCPMTQQPAHDPATRKLAANDGGQVCIHRPGERLLAGRAKLHPREVKNVGGIRQSPDCFIVQEIATNGFDAMLL